MKCIFCDKEATHVYRPDIDVRGLGYCNDHEIDFSFMILHWDRWETEKVYEYIEKVKKRDKKKAQK